MLKNEVGGLADLRQELITYINNRDWGMADYFASVIKIQQNL